MTNWKRYFQHTLKRHLTTFIMSYFITLIKKNTKMSTEKCAKQKALKGMKANEL